jgi:glutamate dehydrogenase (NADP+)
MSQNSLRLSWSEDEMEERLRDIMISIHKQCVTHGKQGKKPVDYVVGANIAGFLRVSDAMLAHGV